MKSPIIEPGQVFLLSFNETDFLNMCVVHKVGNDDYRLQDFYTSTPYLDDNIYGKTHQWLSFKLDEPINYIGDLNYRRNLTNGNS